ncbi:MAG: RNA polymerase sigma factor [Candidatus Aminicenantales bacterium]
MNMDEQELVSRIQQGDEMAFAQIVRNYKDKIVNYLWQLTGDYQKAVELSQETFIRVYFKSRKYKPVAPFSSWIYAIASNLAKTEMKRTRKMKTVPLDNVQPHIMSKEHYPNNESNSDLAKELRKALDSLHPRYRVPVILKDVEGFSQEEIAQMLKKPLGTIKARISRGRNYLKRELARSSIKTKSLEKRKENESRRV